MKKLISKYSILLTCILLTTVSVIVAISSKSFLFKYNLPVRNFVTLSAVISHSPECEGIVDTGVLSSQCRPYEIHNSRASAAAINTVEGKTYMLTAAHFCEAESIFEIAQIVFDNQIEYNLEIIKDGERYPFEIVSYDTSNDLCLITSDYDISENLVIADEMPDVGESVRSISSPLGIAESNVNFHFSGVFSGCNEGMCYFTVPAISGSSGSVILNQDDEIVGMTQRALIGFPDVAIGAGRDEILKFLLRYEKESGIKIIPN